MQMKRIFCAVLCFAFVLLITACSNSGETMTEQYAHIVTEYENQYGVISKERNIFYSSDALGGLSYVDLIDFNADGKDELILIFDQCTYENVMEGALTCHIYADVNGKASLVYDENLSTVDKYSKSGYMGRTLRFVAEGDNICLVIPEHETIELSDYPRKERNYETGLDEVRYDYTFFNESYLVFDGESFSAICKAGESLTYTSEYGDVYMLNNEMCSEQEYTDALKDITEYIECSTYFYQKLLEHNNEIKGLLGLAETVAEGAIIRLPVTTESISKMVGETTDDTVESNPSTASVATTTATTTVATKNDLTVDEIAAAITSHYTAQRTDGGGFSCSLSEAMDMGDYYSFVVRNVRSPEEEAEVDRLFKEEGVIPSANVIAFNVVVEKSTGKVTRTDDNDTWYLW